MSEEINTSENKDNIEKENNLPAEKSEIISDEQIENESEEEILIDNIKHKSIFRSFIFYIFNLFFIFVLFSVIVGIGGYFTVLHFIKGEVIEIPNIIGKDIDEALKILQPLQLPLKLDDYEYNELVPVGNIISQYPYPGTNAKKGSPVKIVISKGSPLISVPNLIGESALSAEVKIRGAGLKVGNHSYIYGEQSTKDKIIGQDPLPMTGVKKDHQVNLLINTGPLEKKIIMPDLSNSTLTEAQEILNKIGIKIISIDRRKSTEKPEGMILEQNPKPGNFIQPETQVVLVVSAGA